MILAISCSSGRSRRESAQRCNRSSSSMLPSRPVTLARAPIEFSTRLLTLSTSAATVLGFASNLSASSPTSMPWARQTRSVASASAATNSASRSSLPADASSATASSACQSLPSTSTSLTASSMCSKIRSLACVAMRTASRHASPSSECARNNDASSEWSGSTTPISFQDPTSSSTTARSDAIVEIAESVAFANRSMRSWSGICLTSAILSRSSPANSGFQAATLLSIEFSISRERASIRCRSPATSNLWARVPTLAPSTSQPAVSRISNRSCRTSSRSRWRTSRSSIALLTSARGRTASIARTTPSASTLDDASAVVNLSSQASNSILRPSAAHLARLLSAAGIQGARANSIAAISFCTESASKGLRRSRMVSAAEASENVDGNASIRAMIA